MLSAVLILLQHQEWQTAVLLACCIWGFSRFYYFAFYVIEKYVDPTFRFTGLWDFARYLIGKKRKS